MGLERWRRVEVDQSSSADGLGPGVSHAFPNSDLSNAFPPTESALVVNVLRTLATVTFVVRWLRR